MAIEKKTIRDVQQGIRAVYQKALEVLDTKNGLDYGIELLKGVVCKEPGFMDARKSLRDAEKKKLATMGGFTKFMANLKLNKFILKGKTALNKNPREAMANAEEALAMNPASGSALNLLAEAAQALDAHFIAIEAMETLVEQDPENETYLENLAQVYEKAGDGLNLLKVRQKFASMHPGDLEVQAKLRAAAAVASMEQGKWNDKKSDFREHLKSQDAVDATSKEQGDKIIRAADDIRAVIVSLEKKLADGDKSLDMLKKLADFYMRDSRYEDAIKTYNMIVEVMGALDPSVDKSIERANVAILQLQLDQLTASGASPDQLAAVRQQEYDYRLSRAEDRIRLYPNDMQLRYEVAEIYWEGKFIDKALEQFQLAQKNPQRRLNAIVYLGRCFSAKGQFDMAVEQFNKALAEMYSMDKDKMNATYYLGITFDAMGEKEKAMDCFKQIYSVNVNFLDVAQRMNAYYASKKANA